ncbi:nucleoside-triphosphatase THEP1 isoform X1 [Dendroctonus ponderosae]|uniref:nucleoside-triphosphatase THEP1 isoform X1 n=1 Tax=Dendroctonus ponderosae TaxID=77166 RepID=UPI002035C4C3|nr:nucleoside-triphosphatase THEP1 isoform X1 [Dendroctonus ponderosae]
MKHLLITGDPGVGKTTLVKKIIENLSKSSILFDGFITEEVRNHSFHRTGFEVRLLKSNDVAVLADNNKKQSSDQGVKQLGPYTVYVANFEQLTLQLISFFENGILIIDEIGKMELFSKKFEQCVETAFKKKNIRILATVPVRGPPFVAALKRDNGCQLFTVTRENRDSLVNEISRLLISSS